MAQQTAVEFIERELINVKDGYQYIVLGGEEYVNTKHIKYLLEQAKQMEKEQILDAYEQGAIDGRFEMFSDNTVHNAEAYYNKTFND